MLSKAKHTKDGRRAPGPDQPPQWVTWSDRAICSRACGGQCCKGSIIPISAPEADRLLALAAAMDLEPPGIVPAAIVEVGSAGLNAPRRPEEGFLLQARPCTFLNKDDLCRIYADRPARCRAFPDRLRDSCALSLKQFGGL